MMRSMMIMKSVTSSSPSPSSPCSSNKNNPFSNRSLSTRRLATGFLDSCFLCKQRFLPGKDIYMYKGDTAFCSVECRRRQIFIDEEEEE